MPKDYLPINEIPPSSPHKKYSSPVVTQAKEVDTKPSTPNPESFKGFLLASYKSIANVARAHKITRLMFITYLLILVVTPPIIIMIAFLTFPTQTASFFNFKVQSKQSLTQSANSQVLGESTSDTNQGGGNVLSRYVAAVLEPQAAAAVRALRVIRPETVSDVVLPSEQSGTPQPTQSTATTATPGLPGQAGIDGTQGEAGLQGLNGKDGAKGDTGLTGATGSVGSLTTGGGLTGSISSGNLILDFSSAPTFTTVNGLTITNNGTNRLNISSGKTLTTTNTITFGGTDNTSFTLPSGSDTLVGLSSTDTLTNKTIAAGSNTISGLTNSNLSGSAGITNANLTNSSLTLNGNSGSGSVALGGGLTFTGAGITTVAASGSTLTFTSTEADTMQSVYNRGNTLPTTAGSVANTIDEATINVGNIASTAQQNFSTLNIRNGGTGYLDIELIKGFINFQGMNTLYDDFTQRTLDTNKWLFATVGGGGTCSNTIVAGGVNGLLRIITGVANGRGCLLSTQGTLSNGFYQRGNNPVFETKLTMSTTNPRIFAGFTSAEPAATSNTNVSTHHAYIEKRSTDTTWQCTTDDGGATETITDTGVTISASTFYRLRVEVRSGTTPETICTIDDGTTVTRTVVTATQPGATASMDVFIQGTNADTTAENVDIDYVRVWQDDPAGTALTIESAVSEKEEDATDSATQVSTPKTDSDNSENFVSTIFESLISWFANTTNGIKDFFANRVHAKQLCIGEKDDETCVEKSQLDQLLLKNEQTNSETISPIPSPSPTATPNIAPTTTTEQTSTASATTSL